VVEAVNPPVIQRIAPGLVGFLGIKNVGRGNPLTLSEVLSGTLELNELYFKSAAVGASVNVAAPALGYNALTILMQGVNFSAVPNDEAWIVWEAHARTAALTAGQIIQFAHCYTSGIEGGPTVQVGDLSNAGAVGQQVIVGLDRPYLAAPNSTLVLYLTQLAAGPVATTINHVVTRLKL
jgi:hypothetical protein